jgi:hypothetical protein
VTVTDSEFRSINGTESKVHEAKCLAWGLWVVWPLHTPYIHAYVVVDGPFLLFHFDFLTSVLLFLIALPVRYHITALRSQIALSLSLRYFQSFLVFSLYDVGVLSLFNKGSRSRSRSISTDPPRTRRRQKKAMPIPAPISDNAVASACTPSGSCHPFR